jgi:serine/threonine protein kinase
LTVSGLDPVAQSICSSIGLTYVRPVGAGAFKQTFEVHDGSDAVALKVYDSAPSPARAQREIDAMLRCNHGNIARLRSVATFSHVGRNHLYCLEEFLAGGTLGATVAQHGLLPPDRTRAIARSLTAALAHIAARRLVHRDIKPENVMLRADGVTPVIVDFGLVRDLVETSLTQSWLPQGPGTPYFAPPEQLLNEKLLIDWRADQFSLAVTLAIVTFGFHPYAEYPTQSPADVVSRVLQRRSPSADFERAANQADLSVLIRMAAPWPVQRLRTPEALTAAFTP